MNNNTTTTTRNNVTLAQYQTVEKIGWNDRTDADKEISRAWEASVKLDTDTAKFEAAQAKIQKATAGKIQLVRVPNTWSETHESFGTVSVQLESVGLKLASWDIYDLDGKMEAFLLGVAFSKKPA